MPELLFFQTGNIHFAIERNTISHIGSPTAGFPAGLCRVLCRTVAHKGGSLALIDLAATLDQCSKQPYPPEPKVIMLKTMPATGLLAEQVHAVLDVDTPQMDALPPVFTNKARACFPQILRLDDHLVLVIDAATLPELLPDSRQSANALPPACTQAENKPVATQDKDRSEEKHLETKQPVTEDMEALIVSKFQEIIGRRVERLLSQTMAQAVERCEVRV